MSASLWCRAYVVVLVRVGIGHPAGGLQPQMSDSFKSANLGTVHAAAAPVGSGALRVVLPRFITPDAASRHDYLRARRGARFL